MILILKRIDRETRVADIEDFLAPALKGGFLRKSGRLDSVAIQKHSQAGGVYSEYHAIVRIEPERVAKRVIKRLNRKRLIGKPINIAEFHFRSYTNDREGRYQTLSGQRSACRRRKDMEIVDITAKRQGLRLDLDSLWADH